MSNNQNLTVTKANDLNEASYRVTLDERRLILVCIAKINSRGDVPDVLVITGLEYAEMFGLKKHHAYEQLDMAASNLYERDIKINNPDRQERTRFRWVDYVKYYDGEGKVELSFSRKVKPYLGQLKSHFTSYKLHEIKRFKSGHAIRIYELLEQYKTVGKREITVEQLKSILSIENQYKLFAEFRRNVIVPSLDEINRNTTLQVEWKGIKKGRSFHSILFTFERKPQRELFE